jgi:hypothetical protein
MKWEGEDTWAYLISAIVVAIEAAPEGGKRATRDRPSEKTIVLERQKKADSLIAKAATAAAGLAQLLADIRECGGETPGESYNGLALIENAIQASAVSSTYCEEHFKKMRCGMSSREKHNFPSTEQIISELAIALENHLPCKERFADDPWLQSSHSSWKDYVRVLRASFEDMHHIYGVRLSLTDGEWTALCQVMLDDPTITRQVVSKGLKEL